MSKRVNPKNKGYGDAGASWHKKATKGFFADPAIRAAYLGAEWIGPSQGQLDPTKEITAEILAIGEGITTREQATIRLNGGQWDANVDQIARENRKLWEALETPTQSGGPR